VVTAEGEGFGGGSWATATCATATHANISVVATRCFIAALPWKGLQAAGEDLLVETTG
jgi:hypothetical protein